MRDSDGMPAAGAYVIGSKPSDRRGTTATADAAGRFALSPLEPGQIYERDAQIPICGGGHAIVHRSGVVAGSEEVELRATADRNPTARLRGRVLRSGGAPAAGSQLVASPLDGLNGSATWIDSDGGFELGPWQPVRVRFTVHASGVGHALADFGVHEMRAGETVDVGELLLPTPGSARIRIEGAEDGRASLFREGAPIHERPIAGEPIEWNDLQPVKCPEGDSDGAWQAGSGPAAGRGGARLGGRASIHGLYFCGLGTC